MNKKVIDYRLRSKYVLLSIGHPTFFFFLKAAYLIHCNCLRFKNAEFVKVVLDEQSQVVTHHEHNQKQLKKYHENIFQHIHMI